MTLSRLEIDFLLTVLRHKYDDEDTDDEIVEAITLLEALIEHE